MILLKTEEIKPGMILQEDVVDNSGRLIISSGTILNEKHLRIMMIWGIGEAYILNEKKLRLSDDISEKTEKEFQNQPFQSYVKNNISSEMGKKIFMFNDLKYPFISLLYETYLKFQCKVK